ncbi:MAG: Na+/H+ antiporter NhaC family protein, partial [Proteobacteria bacterium]|nr:Na+/H+ antiporter NhaC family protein [Pseudomonadota bacterium]
GISPGLVLGAVLGGSVFGDHASPISDTTVIASLAAGCDLLDHVKTQLPYALVGGGLSVILYVLFGLFYSS